MEIQRLRDLRDDHDKTQQEIASLSDLSADSDTSATRTNAALKEMTLECLAVAGGGRA